MAWYMIEGDLLPDERCMRIGQYTDEPEAWEFTHRLRELTEDEVVVAQLAGGFEYAARSAYRVAEHRVAEPECVGP